MKEIWKDIEGFEGYYQVSNLGRIKSKKRVVNNKGTYGGKCTFNEKILNTTIDNIGYKVVVLSKDKIKSRKRVHRIVAKCFIPNPNGYKEVNHKDGIKKNSRVDNLEWCTHKENIQHAYKNNLINRIQKNKGKLNIFSKAILQYDRNGKFIKEWECIRDIERELKICNQNISKCCKGIYNTCGGYIFKYKQTL